LARRCRYGRRVTNRLSSATSPYLLQHADNPVDWWEWGPDAFAEARRLDRPVLLSVGYASCHWCHVMAHESFEDDATAAILNERFVNIKVDREERPDVDRIYMDAVQAMSGHGGWPMTVFLTPDGEPFFAGTYFPKEDRAGHPSFTKVLDAVHEAWTQRRGDVESQASRLAAAVAVVPAASEDLPGAATLERAYRTLESAFDEVHAGFGGAPKFPQAPTLELLLRLDGHDWAPRSDEMLVSTLDAMADGGIRDHVAGGFARYSVDDRWLVPHFEKMLYDNALLARLYARAHQVTGNERFADVAGSTLDYLLTDLCLDEGGFASAEDADSEGEEGKFYVFSWEELRGITDSEAVTEVLGAAPGGNFEGKTIVHRARPVERVAAERGLDPAQLEADVESALRALADLRANRVRPELDDKAVCAWNGLAIRALAEAGTALQRPDYTDAAADAAGFVLEHMRREDGRLLRAWRAGRTSGPAYCDDYAAIAVGLFALYQATGDAQWFTEARRTTEAMIELFWDDDHGGFFATGADAEALIARPKNLFDNPTPSDNSLAAEALQLLAAYSGEGPLLDKLEQTIRSAAALLERYPTGAGWMLSVLHTHLTGMLEVAVVGAGPARRQLVDVVTATYRPGIVLAIGDGRDARGIPLLEGRPPIGDAAAYVCRGFVCDAPVTDPAALETALG